MPYIVLYVNFTNKRKIAEPYLSLYVIIGCFCGMLDPNFRYLQQYSKTRPSFSARSDPISHQYQVDVNEWRPVTHSQHWKTTLNLLHIKLVSPFPKL